jgi:hypothetical protein
LPWPKIAQTPPKIGSFSLDLGHLRGEIARQRLRHGEADGFGHGALSKYLSELSGGSLTTTVSPVGLW